MPSALTLLCFCGFIANAGPDYDSEIIGIGKMTRNKIQSKGIFALVTNT